AAAILVAVARRFTLAAQRLELVPWLDLMLEELGTLAIGQRYQHRLLERHYIDHLAASERGLHFLAALGQGLARLDVLLVFVDQAASQTAAHAGDLARVERDALCLGHLDGDGAEV